MLKIGVLISGGGTNLQAVIDACETKVIDGAVVGVISNKFKAFGLERAKKHQIPHFYIGKAYHEDPKVRTKEIVKIFEDLQVDLIVLAGYLEILQPELIQAFENRIINIHPSLIPKYAGKGYYGMKVHQAVIDNRETESGATVHYVDEGVDTGSIIIQGKVAVLSDDTKESLQKKVLEIEHRILIEAINKVREAI